MPLKSPIESCNTSWVNYKAKGSQLVAAVDRGARRTETQIYGRQLVEKKRRGQAYVSKGGQTARQSYGEPTTGSAARLLQYQLLAEKKRLEVQSDLAKAASTQRLMSHKEVHRVVSRVNGKNYSEAAKYKTTQRAAKVAHHHTTASAEAKSTPQTSGRVFPTKGHGRLTRSSLNSSMTGKRYDDLEIWSSQQLTSGQIDSLMDKLYCMPKTQRNHKEGFRVEEVVERMLAEKDLTQRDVAHEEIDDYLLRLKVTRTPRTEQSQLLRPDCFQHRRKGNSSMLDEHQSSPVRLKRPKTPTTLSIQSTARTEALTVRSTEFDYLQEGSKFPYSSYRLSK